MASIGPRSIDRGNFAAARNLPLHLTASIGPRSIDRGNAGARRKRGGAGPSFNWAAVDRPRKPERHAELALRALGFNWAAVDRPRKRRVAGLQNGDCQLLQLGRGRSTAETSTLGDVANLVASSFNWAAVDRPRKLDHGREAGIALEQLQLGRGRSTAETSSAFSTLRRRRSLQLGRGRSTAETWFVAVWCIANSKLQLGRGRSTAETSPGTSSILFSFSLQLGRGRSTAETGQCPCETCRRERASIGPRSIDRGNWGDCFSISPWTPRFNWAAVDRPRKPAWTVGSGSNNLMLQLGRGRSTAETPRGITQN